MHVLAQRRVGLYPGTFDPITLGHLDIIRRASGLVDHMAIGVAINRDKGPLFTLEERIEMVEAELGGLNGLNGMTFEIIPFENLLVQLAEQAGANIIIRGLRAVSDFDYEFQMVGMNRRMNPNVETVFLMASERHQFIASRLVKEIARLDGRIEEFVSPTVAARVYHAYGKAPAAAGAAD